MAIKLGMLGMWHSHAAGIVRRVAEHPDEFQLVGFWDKDAGVVADRSQAWSKLLDRVRVFDRPEELLAEELDGVVVEGRVYENLRLARIALERGLPVMLEKPAGDNYDEHRRLIDLAQRKHLHVQMIYLFRYMPAVEEMLKLARDARLGRIYEFRARLPKPIDTYDHFVDELKPYKGGMFFEMAGHVIDMMVSVLGRPNQIKAVLGHHHERPPETYVDNGAALFGYERAIGIIEVPAMEAAPRSRRIEVYGTGGACVIPHLGSGHLANRPVQILETFTAGQRDWQRHELDDRPLQLRDLREFAAVVGQGKAPEYSFEHDLIVQDVLLAASGMR